MLLFTTDRTVVAKANSKLGYIRYEAELMARSTQIDEILSENKKNYAIPHLEITQLRVKLPGALTKGRVTLTTAQGENVFKIGNKGALGIKDNWEFLKSPPPKLAKKLVVE